MAQTPADAPAGAHACAQVTRFIIESLGWKRVLRRARMHMQSRGVLCGTVVTHGVAGGSANPAYWLALLSTYMAYEMGELAAQFGVLKLFRLACHAEDTPVPLTRRARLHS